MTSFPQSAPGAAPQRPPLYVGGAPASHPGHPMSAANRVPPPLPTLAVQNVPQQHLPAPAVNPGTPIVVGGPPAVTRRVPILAKDHSKTTLILAVVGIAVMTFMFVLLITWLFQISDGQSVLPVAFVAALVPLAAVLVTVFWIDRIEPEPAPLLAFALLWGAAVSTAASLFASPWLSGVLGLTGSRLEPAIVAPIVEELFKGLGLVAILLIARRNFNGPVDGIVYSSLIAGGFAFTENVLYFSSASWSGTLGQTFVARGIFGAFGHVLFTACIGIAVGYAVRRGLRGGVFAAFLVGLIFAMIGHGIWNGTSSLAPISTSSDIVLLYALLNWLPFVLFIALVYELRKRELRSVRRALSGYFTSGWLSAVEYDLLSKPKVERAMQRWAGGVGRGSEMKAMRKTGKRLAQTRIRLETQPHDQRDLEEERFLLERFVGLRARVLR